MDIFSSEVLGIVSLLAVILITGFVVLYHTYLRPRLEKSDFYQRYALVFDTLDEVVTATVMRLAFSGEDLSAFGDEAARTGRDVRLVAAIHLIDRYTSSHGVNIDEEYIISAVEDHLEQLKQAGIIQ